MIRLMFYYLSITVYKNENNICNANISNTNWISHTDSKKYLY
jgi:hypothetical protein